MMLISKESRFAFTDWLVCGGCIKCMLSNFVYTVLLCLVSQLIGVKLVGSSIAGEGGGAYNQISWQAGVSVGSIVVKRKMANESDYTEIFKVAGSAININDGAPGKDESFDYRFEGYSKKGIQIDAAWKRVGYYQTSLKLVMDQSVNVVNHGVDSTGSVDVTSLLQNLVDGLGATGGTLFLIKGKYLIDARVGLSLKSNITLLMQDGAVLRAKPNDAQSYHVIGLNGVKHVAVVGGVVEGERYEHYGEGGQWGMGIKILDSSDVIISGVRVLNAWGDGVYIGGNTKGLGNITLSDVVVNNSRRNGLTIIGGQDISVINLKVMGSAGTPPQAGVDIEPNYPHDRVRNIRLVNLYTENNAGAGFQMGLGKLSYESDSFSVKLVNHRDVNSGTGLLLSNKLAMGVIDIDGGVWIGTGARVKVRNPSRVNSWIQYRSHDDSFPIQLRPYVLK